LSSFIVPPRITNRSNAVVDVEEGEDLNLQCEAGGDPTPFIEWTKGDVLLQSRNTSTALVIPKIERKDGGNYVCTAVNSAGSVSYSILVRVLRYRPYINKAVSSNAIVKSWLSHVTSFKCVVDANPAANFTWFKDGQAISSGVTTTHNMSILTLAPSAVDDFGRYSCKASNFRKAFISRIIRHSFLS